MLILTCVHYMIILTLKENKMTENLLQFIWLHRLYNTSVPFKTTDGETIIILHPGHHNTNAGPDFSEAKIKIGNTVWVGNIEMHVRSSDWNKHKHELNENYNRIILHVVYINDAPVKTMQDAHFMTLELFPFLQKNILANYESMMQSKSFVPCEKNISDVKSITIQQQLQRMLAERLEEKTNHIKNLLSLYKNNWQEVFYVQLARGFGLHINQDAFEQLALQTPLSLFAKHKNNNLQIEALLFGQAGFLSDYFDEVYPLLLQNEYSYLQKLHNLQPVDKNLWKFLRLRPANFPTIRIAQFAQLILHSTHLFSKITSANSLKEIEKLFEVDVSDYWLAHYTFQEKSVSRTKKIGKSFIHTLIINAVIPTLFIYGKLQGKNEYCDKAIQFLQQLPPEKNNITGQWQNLHVSLENAADTQAVLQLHKKYCITKQCLSCSVGYEILKRKEN